MAGNEDNEPDHHPYRRPVDAATLILVDRSGAIPKVLVGKRHDKVVFQPGKIVFPGGRVDPADNRVPVAAPIPAELEANLLKGSPKVTSSRARALAVAAIREACEETGLCLGRKPGGPVPALSGPWKPFTDAGLLPDPSGLLLIARAITPPGRVRRYADAELVELVWVELGSKPLADLHRMTQKVLDELGKRLATGPLRHDAEVPFFRAEGGGMRRDILQA
jgi:8-oxo-dGTP pyrophosphatase MutT (NUDIX family)